MASQLCEQEVELLPMRDKREEMYEQRRELQTELTS